MISQVRNCGPRGQPHERRFLLAIARVPDHGVMGDPPSDRGDRLPSAGLLPRARLRGADRRIPTTYAIFAELTLVSPLISFRSGKKRLSSSNQGGKSLQSVPPWFIDLTVPSLATSLKRAA
jgi:hypothetical protein